jgi:hypothetical protein
VEWKLTDTHMSADEVAGMWKVVQRAEAHARG